VSVLRKAAAMDPAIEQPWILIAKIAEHRKDFALAEKLYRKALAVNPRSEQARAEQRRLEGQSKKGGLLDKLLGR